MQERQDRPDYPTVDDPSFSSTLSSAENAGTSVSALKPYIPPNVPHGFPHVIRFATLSSMDLPLEVRFLASGRRFFSRRLSNPLPARGNDHSPQQLRNLATSPRTPQVRGIGSK